MLPMPAIGSPILPWVDQALAAAGHPSVAKLVAKGRAANPRTTWDDLARNISQLAGNKVSAEWVRQNFGHLDGGAA